MPASHPVSDRMRRLAGLDGLRAIAVTLVLIYHLFPGALPGGFLGVDVFFVISGFLITSLLLRELQDYGRIRLRAFWQRRARRLLPALALVLLVCTSLALLVPGDLLVGISSQVAGASLFVSNWVFIANGADYFARDTPELFRNTWSLSIEEQFYILLPLIVLALWRLRRPVTRAIPLLVLGVASAILMVELSVSGADPTRIYFGSDTHTFGLFLGAATATLLHRADDAPVGRPRVMAQIMSGAVAIAGLVTLVVLSLTLVEGSSESFRGGFQLATVAALAVVVAVTREGMRIGTALDLQPLRWIGERSYGIYLWHWPLLLIITAALSPWRSTPAGPWIIGAVTLGATLVIAAASYRYVEQPVRRWGLRGAARRLLRLGGGAGHRSRLVGITLVALLVITVPTTGYAIATAPRMTSAAEAVARGQAEMDAQAETEEQAQAEAEEQAQAEASDATEAEARTDEKPDTSTEASHGATPIVPEGRDISAIGDSVMLASLPELNATFPSISVDAAVSRGLGAGVGIASELDAEGTLREVLVVGLGTNGPMNVDDLEALRQLAGTRPLVLVNAHGEREWIPGVNELLNAFADSYRGVVVADWDKTVTGVPDALTDDGIHPNSSGGELYAACIQEALAELQSPSERLGFTLPRR